MSTKKKVVLNISYGMNHFDDELYSLMSKYPFPINRTNKIVKYISTHGEKVQAGTMKNCI